MSFKVLMYHEIRNNIVQGLDIDVANGYQDVLPKPLYAQESNFRKQMVYLKQSNYYFMTLQDVRDFYETGKMLPQKSILLTFDDGFQSQYHNAYPVLKELGIPAVMFYIGSWLHETDKPMSHARTRTMTHDQMAEIQDVFETAHHTYDLHNRHEFLSYSLETIKEDWEMNKNRVKHADVFAYPFGLFNETIVRHYQTIGTRYAFTSEPGVNTQDTDPLYLNRYIADYDMDLEAFAEMVG